MGRRTSMMWTKARSNRLQPNYSVRGGPTALCVVAGGAHSFLLLQTLNLAATTPAGGSRLGFNLYVSQS